MRFPPPDLQCSFYLCSFVARKGGRVSFSTLRAIGERGLVQVVRNETSVISRQSARVDRRASVTARLGFILWF